MSKGKEISAKDLEEEIIAFLNEMSKRVGNSFPQGYYYG